MRSLLDGHSPFQHSARPNTDLRSGGAPAHGTTSIRALSRRDFVRTGSRRPGRPGRGASARRRAAAAEPRTASPGPPGRAGSDRGQGVAAGDRLCLLPAQARHARRRHGDAPPRPGARCELPRHRARSTAMPRPASPRRRWARASASSATSSSSSPRPRSRPTKGRGSCSSRA